MAALIGNIDRSILQGLTSIFRPVSRAYSEGRYPRAYSKTRGLLITKDNVLKSPQDLANDGYYFQFNPSQLNDVKQTLWESRGYSGLAYNDYAWGGGGERTISFQLFLDDTPGSHTSRFNPNDIGKPVSKVIDTSNKRGGKVVPQLLSENKYFISQVWGNISSVGRTIGNRTADIFNPGRGPAGFSFTDVDNTNRAFSTTRVSERGVLNDVEKIMGFLYPENMQGDSTPKFAEGGIVSQRQFRTPPVVVFTFGPIYLEGIIKSAPVTYTLFDHDLTPIRATIDIEFAVLEYSEVSRRVEWAAQTTPNYTKE